MEKVVCEECGKEINKKAEICPNCGCRVKSNTIRITLICIIVTISSLLIIYGINRIHDFRVSSEIERERIEDKIEKEKIRNNILGKYVISKQDYNDFVESLKQKVKYINSMFDGKTDFEFEITDDIISKDMGFDGVNYNDTIAFNEDYILIPLGLLGIEKMTGNVSLFKINDNELIQVSADMVDQILENFAIDNYNLTIKKVK